MTAYDYLLLAFAIVGVLDCNLERYSGQGIIGHFADWIDNRGRRAADRHG